MMKAIRRLCSALSTLMVAAMILLAVLLVGVRLIGLTPYAVLSGSMEPTYHVGSLIYVRDIAPEDVQIGTPLTFVVNEELMLATHRVVDVEVKTVRAEPVLDEGGNPLFDEQGNPLTMEVPLDEPAYYFTTKGDANEAVDGSQVYYKNIVGTPVFSVPYLGYLSSWLQTRKGMIMGASIALVLLILTFIPELLAMVDEPAPAPRQKKKQRSKPSIPEDDPPEQQGDDAPTALPTRQRARRQAAQEAAPQPAPAAPAQAQPPQAEDAPRADNPAEPTEVGSPRRRRRRPQPPIDPGE